MIEFGKKCNWNEIVEAYPDMYAIITNVKKKEGLITTCVPLKVVPFEEEEATVCEYMDKGIEFDCVRTTFSAPNRVIRLNKRK